MYHDLPVPDIDSGSFLNWWLENQRLSDDSQKILDQYYKNYKKNFKGYLQYAWSDRHLELEEAVSELQIKENVRVLDLGCGTGSVAIYIAYKLREKAKILGIDINRERLRCATERLNVLQVVTQANLSCDFEETNILCFRPDAKFDLIYLEETFHHLEPREEVVTKISNILKNDGILIISEVNAYNPFMQALLIKKRGMNTVVRKKDKDGHACFYGNERIVPARKLSALFFSNGLRHIKTRYLRLFNSGFVRAFGRHFDLITLEKKFIKLNIFKYFFSIHYNMIFIKDPRPN